MIYTASLIPVFIGPSLPGWRATTPFAAYAPAAAGDMLRLLHGPPCTVVLVDGIFDSRPAVWHKEILVLLARGFRVIGAASMGALRAAELAPFGMIGCGAIYRVYADGRLVADDEVAVTHAPPALGSWPLSLAQVDVRATLCAALRARVIDSETARTLRARSAAIHYRDRNWAAVFNAAATPAATARAILQHTINQKARDARAALDLALALAPEPPVAQPEPPRTPALGRLAAAAGVAL
jgi:hypothetical protein